MMRLRSSSRGRSDSNPDDDPTVGITRKGNRYSAGGDEFQSPIRSPRRHSVGRLESESWTSPLDDVRRQLSPQHLFCENLIVNVSKNLDTIGKKMRAILGAFLELILHYLISLVIQVRRIIWRNSSPYDRRAAQIDVLSFLWVGLWSLVVTLFFLPPDPNFNVVKKVTRFVVGTFQTTGLLYVLFFMLYLHKASN